MSPPSVPARAVTAAALGRLSSEEIVAAIGVPQQSARGEALRWLFRGLSGRLARTLASFDEDVVQIGLCLAARRALTALGVSTRRYNHDAIPREGPLCVVSNHPGAFDALALMAELGRADLRILALDREFLRTLRNLSQAHLLFVDPTQVTRRIGAVRAALTHLRSGGALLHFPAGKIEPDVAFGAQGALIEPWSEGSDALLGLFSRNQAALRIAAVSGVHSQRAKQHFVNRWFERRGVSTVAPLLQLARDFRDVDVNVRFAAPPSEGASATELRALLSSALLAETREPNVHGLTPAR